MYVQYIILLSSYHCVFILFKRETISYTKKWHIILLTYSTANNKHWSKKILFFCYEFTTESWKNTHLFTKLSCEGVWQAERGSNMQTQTNWTQTASLLKLKNKLKTTRKANTTKHETRDYDDKTGNRQRARDREGERNLTDTQRYDWVNRQLNIETGYTSQGGPNNWHRRCWGGHTVTDTKREQTKWTSN